MRTIYCISCDAPFDETCQESHSEKNTDMDKKETGEKGCFKRTFSVA
jgi:hypothetical protein